MVNISEKLNIDRLSESHNFLKDVREKFAVASDELKDLSKNYRSLNSSEREKWLNQKNDLVDFINKSLKSHMEKYNDVFEECKQTTDIV